ncbi:MAG: Uma2 family endonuclease [Candidatus Riflebacteria bacterium]|nr:Uma2 family endonuclease [Candidatus Riflebacteria bacterium]
MRRIRDRRVGAERAGVPEYWIVDPDGRSAVVLVLQEGRYRVFSEAQGEQTIRSLMFPELEVVASELSGPPKWTR